MNNHFNLDFIIPSISNLGPIFDILYPRHKRFDDEKFAFIKDRVTFLVEDNFEIFDEAIDFLEKI
jgi:hypothetical protein